VRPALGGRRPEVRRSASGDFTLAEDSPALELGFQPIDMSDVGVREEGERVWE